MNNVQSISAPKYYLYVDDSDNQVKTSTLKRDDIIAVALKIIKNDQVIQGMDEEKKNELVEALQRKINKHHIFSKAVNFVRAIPLIGRISSAIDQHVWNVQDNYNTGLNALGACYYFVLGGESGKKKAFECYKRAAHGGDSMAMKNVGDCYRLGIGVDIDYPAALDWFKKSANSGNITAILNVASCYERGLGIEKDEAKAFLWCQKAMKKGSLAAIVRLGQYYEHGIGVEKNKKEAFSCYLQAAQLGHGIAMHKVARCYQYGIGVEQNSTTASSWRDQAELVCPTGAT